MKKIYILFLCISIALSSCQNEPKKVKSDKDALNFAENIEQTYNNKSFTKEEAISFHIDLNFGGNERLNATITQLTNSGKIKIEKDNGTTLIYDGNKVYLYPKEVNYPDARFDMFTWSYFFMLPHKLTDPGTVWKTKKERKLEGENYNSATLSFQENIGDAPDDWYIVYSDKNTNLLKAAAYIVTFGKDVNQAEENPHAIVYNNYITVKDIPISTYWKFYNWSEEKGIYGKPIGEALLKDIKFKEITENEFFVPKSAIEIEP
ncbi:DUF6503 family protein [Mesonia maritima]|uniref:Uncharacterized protein n=1 Tax=Mesonia maritima TaxID=1793873 RepID=A0ABU1K793_9FLAO|nr:DUF6503 family protein [Mesonia maritima]MDR6301486.1 hypothetical protein [Mesonia maritima]